MSDKTLDKDGLSAVWLRMMLLLRSLTGLVDTSKGTLQDQITDLRENGAVKVDEETIVKNNDNVISIKGTDTENQFLVSDGAGKTKWLTIANAEEVSY